VTVARAAIPVVKQNARSAPSNFANVLQKEQERVNEMPEVISNSAAAEWYSSS